MIILIHAKCLPVLLYGTEACHILVRGSLEFTVSSSIMKFFRTSSANIVEDCQKLFHFLPISYLIDIWTAKFLENVVRNKNCVCRLFAHNAQCSLDKIFLSYGDDISSSCNLRNFITDMFFEWYYHIWHYRAHVYLVKFFSFSFYVATVWWNKDEYTFSTTMTTGISEIKGPGWRAIPTHWRKASDISTSTLAAFLFSSHPKRKGIERLI